MFEGVPDQFHQFIVSRTSSLPLPISFTPSLHHGSNSGSIPNFDHPAPAYGTTSHHHQQVPLHHQNFLHPLHQSSQPNSKNIDHQEKDENSLARMDLEIERVGRSIQEALNPWSNEEVLALLKIRSSMENWFPEFTWEHVSRKLAEIGFKRSAEKCKEKFEEESRYFNNINYSKNNYRVFGELEELYNHGDNQNPQEALAAEKNKKMQKATQELEEEEEENKIEQNVEEDSRIDQTVGTYPTEDDDNGKEVETSKNKKRKRQKKFEMFKGFCEDIISKIMGHQEEMHKKLLEDMAKRDKEKIAREDAWKKQEMDRINKELELRAQEQVLAGGRQTTIINFLKKFSSSSSSSSSGSSVEILEQTSAHDLHKLPNNSTLSNTTSLVLTQNPNPTSQRNDQGKPEASISTAIDLGHQKSSSSPPKNITPSKTTSLQENQAPQNLSSSSLSVATVQNPKIFTSRNNPSLPSLSSKDIVQKKATTSNDKDDLGKRWPKDEVLALVNLRCSLCNNNEDKESTTVKAPLWERISLGMLELGYKRSAKRCKEKWENINKYFRKTKDVNKKRSVDSRTCPYFHQLSTLYNQGTLASAAPSDVGTEKQCSASPENHTARKLISSINNGSSNSTMHDAEGEKNAVQTPAGFEFEF